MIGSYVRTQKHSAIGARKGNKKMKKVSKILIGSLVGLLLIGLSSPIEASPSKGDTTDEDIVLFQNAGGKFDDAANYILIECKSNSAMKKELEEIKRRMMVPGSIIDFNNDCNVKNVYFCASNEAISDNTISKEKLIKSESNKIKLSKKTAFVKLDQVIFVE